MQNNRTKAITETLKWEGGYTNNSEDSGGPTNWGITIGDACKYWKHDADENDVKCMSKDVAINIYENKYWKTPYYNCDTLASGVDLCVFDFGVNSGPSRANRFLMEAIGGSDTDTINKLCDLRLEFLRRLKNYPTFGKGWTRRVEGIRSTALGMVDTVPQKPVEKPNDGEGSSDTPETIWDRITGWWSRIKSLDFNWKAFSRQMGIALSAVTGFVTDHKLLALAAVVLISVFAVWVALGKPKFWKVW